MSKSPASSFFSALSSYRAEPSSDALAKQKEEAQLREQIEKLAAENESFRVTINLKDEELSKQKVVSGQLLEDVDRLSRDLAKMKEERSDAKRKDPILDSSWAHEAYDVSGKLSTASHASSHEQLPIDLQTSTPADSRKHIMVENIGSPSTIRKLLEDQHPPYADHRSSPTTSHKTSPSITPRGPRRDRTPSIRTDVADTATDFSSVSSDRKRVNLSPMLPLEEDLEARNSQLEDDKGRLRVRLEQVESENRALKSRVERLESDKIMAESESTLDPERATSYQDIIRHLHETISLKDLMIEKSKTEVKLAESRWALAQSDLLNKLQKMEKEKECMQADFDKSIKKVPTLAASGRRESLQIERLTGERDSFKIQLAQLQSEVEHLQQDLAEKAAAITELDSLKPQLHELQSQLTAAQGERDLLKAKLESLTAEREMMKASLASSQADVEKLKRDVVVAKSLPHDDAQKTASTPGSLASSFIGAAVAATLSAFKNPTSPTPTTPDQSRSKPSSSASLATAGAGPTPPPPTSPKEFHTPVKSPPASGPRSLPASTSFSSSLYSPRRSSQAPEPAPIPIHVLTNSFSKPQSPGSLSAASTRPEAGPTPPSFPSSSSFPSNNKGKEVPSSSRAKDASAGTAQGQARPGVVRSRSVSGWEGALSGTAQDLARPAKPGAFRTRSISAEIEAVAEAAQDQVTPTKRGAARAQFFVGDETLAGTAQDQATPARQGAVRTRSISTGNAMSEARTAIGSVSRGSRDPVDVRGVQVDLAKSPPARNYSGGNLRVTPVNDTDELQLSNVKERRISERRNSERRSSWTAETPHDDDSDRVQREYASAAASAVPSVSLLFGIQHNVMKFFRKIASPTPSPRSAEAGHSSPIQHSDPHSPKVPVTPDVNLPSSAVFSRKDSASSEPRRSPDETLDQPVSSKVDPPERVNRPVFTLNFKRTSNKERASAAQVPNEMSKALSKVVASSSKEAKVMPKEELSRLGVFALAGLVSDKKLCVKLVENPNGDDEKAYMHIGSGEICTVIVPSKLSWSDRVAKRILRAVQCTWATCRASGTNKVYEFASPSDLFLDAALDRGRYCFAEHVDRGTIPYTVYVYAAGVSKAEFDRKVARLDFEARDRWAFRTPSKKPLLLLLFDMESRVVDGKRGPGDVITAELAEAAKEKIRSFRGFHPCWRHYLDGIDSDQDPLAKLLWTRKGEFVEDVMFEKEKNRAARVPLKAANANDMIRQLGFIEGKTLGRGGFSSVVSCTKDGKPYAVKIQRFKEWRDWSNVDRSTLEEFELDPAIIEECKVNRLLNTLDWLKKCCPNFIPMRDWFYSPKDGSHIQVIDRCDMTLTQFLECFDEQHPAGFLIALRGILAQVCIAMHHASLAFGFKHADFKAHNILLQFHPDPRKLFPELADIPPTQTFNRRWLRYFFLDDRGQPQNFIFDMTVVPFAKIADFGRSQIYAREMDDSGGFGEAQAPPLHAMTKVYESHDLRFLVLDLLWRSDRLRVRSLQQLFGNAKAREMFEALLGKNLDEVRKRAGACVRAEDATVRDTFGNLPEVTPIDVLRSPCFSHDRRFAMEGIEHTYSNTATFFCCPDDVVLRGLYGGKRI